MNIKLFGGKFSDFSDLSFPIQNINKYQTITNTSIDRSFEKSDNLCFNSINANKTKQ